MLLQETIDLLKNAGFDGMVMRDFPIPAEVIEGYNRGYAFPMRKRTQRAAIQWQCSTRIPINLEYYIVRFDKGKFNELDEVGAKFELIRDPGEKEFLVVITIFPFNASPENSDYTAA